MYLHRTALCVAGCVSTQLRCRGTTGPLDPLRTKPNLLAWCRWRSIRPVQCQVSRLEKTARANLKEKGKSKDGKGKGKGKKGEKSRDQKPIVKTEQFQGYCGYCEKWGHKRANCRKRIADGKSEGGAAAASADDGGEAAAVMEVDDEGGSLGWCFAVASLCQASRFPFSHHTMSLYIDMKMIGPGNC